MGVGFDESRLLTHLSYFSVVSGRSLPLYIIEVRYRSSLHPTGGRVSNLLHKDLTFRPDPIYPDVPK